MSETNDSQEARLVRMEYVGMSRSPHSVSHAGEEYAFRLSDDGRIYGYVPMACAARLVALGVYRSMEKAAFPLPLKSPSVESASEEAPALGASDEPKGDE